VSARSICWLVAVAACSSAPPPASDAAATPPDASGPGFDFAVTWTPVDYPVPSPSQLATFYAEHASYGRMIAVHRPWRASRDTAGVPEGFAEQRAAEAQANGFVLMAGFGFGDQAPADLTSESEPTNNTWTNSETRAAFCQMAATWASEHHPKLLFLGNEIDGYYRDRPADWSNWVSELAACRDAVHAVSPMTMVFTTFQLELVKGQAARTGITRPADWQPVIDVADAVDAIAFTTYPFFEYESPADMPDTYYSEIADHTTKPILFTEIGWTASPAAPYTGSETDQVDLIERLFALTAGLDVRYAAYLAKNDFPTSIIGPSNAFFEIGLRDPSGVPRPADAAWQAAVATYQR